MPIKPYPHLLLGSIYELTPELLRERGVTLLLMDLDNTIAKHGVSAPEDVLRSYVQRLRDAGIEPFIYSNSHGSRASLMAGALGTGYISRAGKPGTKKLERLLAEKGVEPQNAAIVGDQIYKDVLCGRRGGLLTVCVRPVSLKNPFRLLRYAAELPYRIPKDDNK